MGDLEKKGSGYLKKMLREKERARELKKCPVTNKGHFFIINSDAYLYSKYAVFRE
jgi:hypothetical protein